jgi:hypothetical protein
MKITIEVDIPAKGSKAEAEMAVKRHFDPDWMSEWWHIDDVIEQAENNGEQLTEDEAREVLRLMDKYHDCNNGHTWDSMDCYIDHVTTQREAV